METPSDDTTTSATPVISPLSIADITARPVASYSIKPVTPIKGADWTPPDRERATEWIEHISACHFSDRGEAPLMPDTPIRLTWLETTSTARQGEKIGAFVPLWMLAEGEARFLEAYMSVPPIGANEHTTVGKEEAPYRWHMELHWEDFEADFETIKFLGTFRSGMPNSYLGYEKNESELYCSVIEQAPLDSTTPNSDTSLRSRRLAGTPLPLRAITLSDNDKPFKTPRYADEWLGSLGLTGDTRVRVIYRKADTIDGSATTRHTWMPLRELVWPDYFLKTHQSKVLTGQPPADTAEDSRTDWNYPHIDRMKIDYTSFKKPDGTDLDKATLTTLENGMPLGYQGVGRPEATEVDEDKNLVTPEEKEQTRLLGNMKQHEIALAKLTASMPTANSSMAQLLIRQLRKQFDSAQFPTLFSEKPDPNDWYVNDFATNDDGQRTPIASESLTRVLNRSLSSGLPPDFDTNTMGFFTHPDTVNDNQSLFLGSASNGPETAAPKIETAITQSASPLCAIGKESDEDTQTLKKQFLDDQEAFWTDTTWGSDTTNPTRQTPQAYLAERLKGRYSYFVDLYKADRLPKSGLTADELEARKDQDLALDRLLTSPSERERQQLTGPGPRPEAYKVMLFTDNGTEKAWPGAMILRIPGQQKIFVYSLEGGLQVFDNERALIDQLTPVYRAVARKIAPMVNAALKKITGNVFEHAANDIKTDQKDRLDNVLSLLDQPDSVTDTFHLFDNPGSITAETFFQRIETARELSVLGIDAPLDVRNATVIDNLRPNSYRTATKAQKEQYVYLEKAVSEKSEALFKLTQNIPGLRDYAKNQATTLIKNKHPGLFSEDINPESYPDPDRIRISFVKPESYAWHNWNTQLDQAVFGTPAEISLTDFMLSNLPAWSQRSFKNDLALQPAALIDRTGKKIVYPATGHDAKLSPDDMESIVTTANIDENYRKILQNTLLDNATVSKSAQENLLADMRFSGYRTALCNEVFQATWITTRSDGRGGREPVIKHRAKAWLDALLDEPDSARRNQVDGKTVHAYSLELEYAFPRKGGTGISQFERVDGAIVFSDHGTVLPHTTGPIGLYFQNGPGTSEFHEVPVNTTLREYIRELLRHEEWAIHFKDSIPSIPENTRYAQRALRVLDEPAMKVTRIEGDLIRKFYEASVRHQLIRADLEGTSNEEYQQQNARNIAAFVVDATLTFIDAPLVVGAGFKAAAKLARLVNIARAIRSGAVSRIAKNKSGFFMVYGLTGNGSRGLKARPRRPDTAYRTVPQETEQLAGAPLNPEVYGDFRVVPSEAASIRNSVTRDAQGFYRASNGNIYIAAHEGAMYRVHNHTRVGATDGHIVHPVTGRRINDRVTRDTVALVRGPEGEMVRAVGFGLGGGGTLTTLRRAVGLGTLVEQLNDDLLLVFRAVPRMNEAWVQEVSRVISKFSKSDLQYLLDQAVSDLKIAGQANHMQTFRRIMQSARARVVDGGPQERKLLVECLDNLRRRTGVMQYTNEIAEITARNGYVFSDDKKMVFYQALYKNFGKETAHESIEILNTVITDPQTDATVVVFASMNHSKKMKSFRTKIQSPDANTMSTVRNSGLPYVILVKSRRPSGGIASNQTTMQVLPTEKISSVENSIRPSSAASELEIGQAVQPPRNKVTKPAPAQPAPQAPAPAEPLNSVVIDDVAASQMEMRNFPEAARRKVNEVIEDITGGRITQKGRGNQLYYDLSALDPGSGRGRWRMVFERRDDVYTFMGIVDYHSSRPRLWGM